MFPALLTPAPELLLYVAVIVATPGPLNLTLLSMGLAGRRRYGTGLLLSSAVCYSALFAISSSTARQIAAMNPAAFTMLQWTAAGLLLWLAWKIGTAQPRRGGASGGAEEAGVGLGSGLAAGLALVGMGPKAWSTAVAAGLLFCDGALSPAQHAVQFGAVGAVAVLMFCTPWLLAGLALGRRLTSPRALRAVNLTSGGILVSLAAMTVMA